MTSPNSKKGSAFLEQKFLRNAFPKHFARISTIQLYSTIIISQVDLFGAFDSHLVHGTTNRPTIFLEHLRCRFAGRPMTSTRWISCDLDFGVRSKILRIFRKIYKCHLIFRQKQTCWINRMKPTSEGDLFGMNTN